MIIKAAADTKYLRAKKKEFACLSKMCGKLELTATKPEESKFLLALYDVVKGKDYGGKGTVIVNDENDKLVVSYTIEHAQPDAVKEKP